MAVFAGKPELLEVAGAFLSLLTAGLLWAVIGSSRVLHPVRIHLSLLPSDFGLPYESLRFSTADGVPVSAWLIRHPQPRGLLLLLHGFGSCKGELLDVARALYRSGGFSLLLFDFRGHGRSGGGLASFGLREIREVRAALDFSAADPQLKGLPVGCWGLSMGGAVAIRAAARFKEILGVVADSTYSDFGNVVAKAQRLTYHIPRFPLGDLVLWTVGLRLGCRTSDLDPVRSVGRLSPRPLLVVQGGRDVTVPAGEGEALFRAAGEPKEWWFLPEAEHGTGFFERTDEYVRKTTELFRHAFARTP